MPLLYYLVSLLSMKMFVCQQQYHYFKLLLVCTVQYKMKCLYKVLSQAQVFYAMLHKGPTFEFAIIVQVFALYW